MFTGAIRQDVSNLLVLLPRKINDGGPMGASELLLAILFLISIANQARKLGEKMIVRQATIEQS